MTDEVERTTIRTAFLRLMPLLLLCYFLAYIDRINIGFAALTMNRDLGLSAYVYGVGAGLFFWGYFFFEVPSNLILEKVGARRWIADGVTANIVVPGRIATGRVRFLDQEKARRQSRTVDAVVDESTASIPLKRYGRPEEYADTVAYLASTRASYITGAVIRVDGGLLANI